MGRRVGKRGSVEEKLPFSYKKEVPPPGPTPRWIFYISSPLPPSSPIPQGPNRFSSSPHELSASDGVLKLVGYMFTPCDTSFAKETPEDGGWHDQVAKGFIEYIDTEEEETSMISMTINSQNPSF